MHLVFEEIHIDITYRPELNNVKIMVWIDDSVIAEGVYSNFLEIPSVKEILLESGINV